MHNPSPQLPRLQGPPTLLIVLASIVSAFVVTACEPEISVPMSIDHGASLSAPAVRTLQEAAPHPHFIQVAESRPSAAARHGHGEVRSIEPIRAEPKATGAGAAIGGVAGGVLGHQFGSGRGNTVATVAGAVGGAVAGHQVEKHRSEKKIIGYRVKVRLDTGESRSIRMSHLDGLKVGDRVRVNGERPVQRI